MTGYNQPQGYDQQQQQPQQQQGYQQQGQYQRPHTDQLIQQSYPKPAPGGIEMFFQKKILFIGLALGALLIFLCSAMTAYSTDVDILKLARLLKGLGGTMAFVSGIAGGLAGQGYSNYEKLGSMIVAAWSLIQI